MENVTFAADCLERWDFFISTYIYFISPAENIDPRKPPDLPFFSAHREIQISIKTTVGVISLVKWSQINYDTQNI